jgi:hypothetical protein
VKLSKSIAYGLTAPEGFPFEDFALAFLLSAIACSSNTDLDLSTTEQAAPNDQQKL